MTARNTNHSKLLALTLAVCLAACSSPTTQVSPTPEVTPDTDIVTAPLPTEPDLSITPEPGMDIPDGAETAAQSGFGGLKTFGVAMPGYYYLPYNLAREAHADAAGNVYVAGSTTAAFGGQGLKGGIDAFLIKFNPSGQLQWVRLLGSAGDDAAFKVVPSPNGNVYVAGTTNGALFAAPLDPSTMQTRADLFLAKFDTNGNQLWGKQFGSNGLDLVSDMRVDINGNAIVSGAVQNTLAGINGTSGKGPFVLFAGPQGVLTSARFYDVGNDTATFVKLDRSLNVYVNSTTLVQVDQSGGTNTTTIDRMTKFLANGTRQHQFSSPAHNWKGSYSYLSDSNGVTFLTTGGKGGFNSFQRFDAGISSWYAAPIRQFVSYGSVVAAQAISNADAYALFTEYSTSNLIRFGAGGAIVKNLELPSDVKNGVYTSAQAFNLDRQGNIFVVGFQNISDANGNNKYQPFVAKYNSSFVLQ
jgi:Beta-propeller repeat